MAKNYRTNPEVIAELQRIASLYGGLLVPERVVQEAQSESSVLHGSFTWDDEEAAHQYRLEQARRLIRTTVRLVEVNGDNRPVRVFVSLTPDQGEEGGGYRDVIAVLSDKDMRRQMLQDALDELDLFQTRYNHLKELTEVFIASKKVRNTLIKEWAA